MEINGKEVPHREHYGPEWEEAMMGLDKGTIIQMLKKKGIAELRDSREGMPSEGLQIQRFDCIEGELHKHPKGVYCLFSDAEKFHTIANDKVAENMKLTAKIAELKAALGDKP